MMLKRVCVVPVCYNAYDDALRFLSSLNVAFGKTKNLHLDVILADNSIVDAPAEIVQNNYLFCYQYNKNQNVGYFPAFYRAMQSNLNAANYDYVVVCNVDLVVGEDFLSKLVELSCSSEVGLIAPGIFSDRDGRDLNPKIMHRPKLSKLRFMRLVCSHVLLFRAYGKLVRLRERARSHSQKRQARSVNVRPVHDNRKIYGAHGSFMIFPKSYFLRGATIDYPRFLFGEEVFVAEQLRMHQLDVVHVPQLRIFDKEHASTSQANVKFISGEHKKSYDYLISNYFK